MYQPVTHASNFNPRDASKRQAGLFRYLDRRFTYFLKAIHNGAPQHRVRVKIAPLPSFREIQRLFSRINHMHNPNTVGLR